MEEKIRKYSIGNKDDEERIHIMPSTELIPDEYNHDNNELGLVVVLHGFSTQIIETKDVLIRALSDQGYKVEDSNVIQLIDIGTVLEKLRRVSDEDHSDKTCLLVFVIGKGRDGEFFFDNEDLDTISIADIWSIFAEDPDFRNKPKIFIFQGYENEAVHQNDGISYFEPPAPKGSYLVPIEADMLIVYKQEQFRSTIKFMEELCQNIDEFGQKEDIISLVTYSENEYASRPLLMSTLTKRFYISSSGKRGHYLDIDLHQQQMFDFLEDLYEKLDAIYRYERTEKTGPKKKNGNSFKKVQNYLSRFKTKDNATKPSTSSSQSKSLKNETDAKTKPRSLSIASTTSSLTVKKKPWRY